MINQRLKQFHDDCFDKELELPKSHMDSMNLYQAVHRYRRTLESVKMYWAGNGNTEERVYWFTYPNDLEALVCDISIDTVIGNAIQDWFSFKNRNP